MSTVDSSKGLAQKAYDKLRPGEHLRLVREQCRRSREDIAGKLNLRISVIEAIENDDYSRFPNFAFIRGYLRAYANLLNIAADDIVSAFNQLGLPEPVLELPVVNRQYRQQYSMKSRSFRWLNYLIIMALIVLIALGWNSYKSYLAGDKGQILMSPQELVFIERKHETVENNESSTNNYPAALNLDDVMPISEISN